MKTRLLITIAALSLVGCASNQNPDTCKAAVTAYQLYQASLADGRVPSADERRIALAAAAFLQLQCGWVPAVPATTSAPAGRAVAPQRGSVDVNGVPYLIP